MAADEQTRIDSLARMARSLGRAHSVTRLLEIAADEARGVLGAASVSVSRLDPAELAVRTMLDSGDLPPSRETGSALSAPLLVDDTVWGELLVTRHRRRVRFDRLDAAYLDALLAILGSAVSRAQREESLQQLAYRDALTGLLNRRALDEHARERFLVEPGRTRTVTAVTLDVNRLKAVNDTLGHFVGDQLIAAVARDLHRAFCGLRDALVTRVGGDEFTVLVSGVAPDRVVAIADELCARTWAFGPGASVSAGAAWVRLRGVGDPTPSDLFAAADRAQYVAKHGRLATTVVSGELEPALMAEEA